MRVGIDCRTILNPDRGEAAGVGHYTYYLVKNILALDRQTEFVLFFDFRMRREGTQEFQQPNVRIRYFPFSSYKKFLPFAYSHMLTAAALIKERLNVFHSPSTTMPLTYPKGVVVTVHDLAIFSNPSWFPQQIFSTRLLVPQTLKRARRIIAVSHSAKKDLEDIFNVPPKKIHVVYEGVTTDKLDLRDKHVDVRKKFGLPAKYLLFVGTLEARKNLPALIDAYAWILREVPALVKDTPLVLAGGTGFKGDDVLEKIRGMRLQSQVRYLGYVTHNEKINLISHALAFLFPSLHEGFGLPVLEAMNLGTPVLTSNVTSLPEIARDAALLVDPTDAGSLTDGLRRLLEDDALRRKLREKGLARAKDFSWRKTAEETLGIYRAVAAKEAKRAKAKQAVTRK